MSIQKKSLLNSLNTTKKAIVASSTPAAEGNPSVSETVKPRLAGRHHAPVMGAKIGARLSARLSARVVPRKKK